MLPMEIFICAVMTCSDNHKLPSLEKVQRPARRGWEGLSSIKKFTHLILLLLLISFTTAAQTKKIRAGFRKMRPDEVVFLNNLHLRMFEAIPHTYKNWGVDELKEKFDINKYWCGIEVDWYECNGVCPNGYGYNDAYSLDCMVDFAMPDDDKGKLFVSAFKSISDYNDAGQIANSLKMSDKAKLSIKIFANMDIGINGAFPVSYCGKTPPAKIALPVPATLAVKGIRSLQCPIMSDGRIDMSGDYYDNATVFLGKPVVNTATVNNDNGLTTTRYAIGFDGAKRSRLIVQNIVVTFKGDSADIDEAIKLIDWKKLYDLVAKQ